MQVFTATLNQMLVLFIFMALGFFLNKKRLLPLDDSVVLSKLETYAFVPCLVFSVFYKYCTVENFKQKWTYMLYGAAVMAVSLPIGIVLAKFFAKDGYLKKIYTYSFAVANFSFMGNAVVLGVFGEKVLFDYMIFTLPLNLYVYSIGTASLIPTEKGGKLSVKTFVNPIFIALILGAVCGLLAVPLPKFITTAISSAGACMSPLAMLLTGFVIGEYSLKTLASDKKVYLASVIRLIILPSAFMAVLLLLKTDKDIIRVALCATAMPLGLNTVVFPAAYGGDTTPGAGMALEKSRRLRLPSIRSKVKPVEIFSVGDINADISLCGLKGSPTRVLKTFENDSGRRSCTFISPEKTAEKIRSGHPDAVLWGSDIKSKALAPQVAALLNTGLCADCTSLETDGETLYMYRPACSGNIIAKIKCETKPPMATVRTAEEEQNKIIIGIGYGARERIAEIKKFAEKINAGIAATRKIVDSDYLPYELQVGLTGKTVNPDVYIAVGISGAVHHIAGIKRLGTVIAINTDKDAPIFKYADFGIVSYCEV